MKKAILCLVSIYILFLSSCTINLPFMKNTSANSEVTTKSTQVTASNKTTESLTTSILSTTIDKEKCLDGKKLVVFGDSITANGTWGETTASELNMYFYNGAKGGITSEEGLTRFDHFVRQQNPDFVTILFGQNDLLMVGKNTPKVTIERFKENLTTMVGWVREIGATPILLTNNPLNPDIFYTAQGQNEDFYSEVGTPLEWLDQYNEAIREVAEELDCYLVDNRITFSEKYYKSYLLDGIHLNTKGNKKFSENLIEFFKANYVNDPTAKKVSAEDLYVYVDETCKTKSIVSFDSSYWTPQNDYLKIKTENNKIEIYNTNGEYPYVDYEIVNPVACPVENGYIKYDIELQNTKASIIVYIDGFSPSTDIAGTYFVINSNMTDSVEAGSGDIVGPIHLTGTIALSDLEIAKTRLHQGCVAISGIKIYASGNAYQKIIINELSVSIEEIE